MTYYKKIGRKYVPVEFQELDHSWPPGLYLIYQNKHSSSIENLTVQKVHTCKDLSLYADMVVNLERKVAEEVMDSLKERYSIKDVIRETFISIINNLPKQN